MASTKASSLYEDQTLWVKIMLRFPVYVTDVVGARYRQHPASATAASERSGQYDRLGPHAARVAFLRWVRAEAVQRRPGPLSVRGSVAACGLAAAGDEPEVSLTAAERAIWLDGPPPCGAASRWDRAETVPPRASSGRSASPSVAHDAAEHGRPVLRRPRVCVVSHIEFPGRHLVSARPCRNIVAANTLPWLSTRQVIRCRTRRPAAA